MKAGRRFGFHVLFWSAAVILTAGMLELASRAVTAFIYPDLTIQITRHQDLLRQSLTAQPRFQPHPYLAYTPGDVVMTETGCRIGTTQFLFTKPNHTLRVACLGGSTTKNAYTRWLQEPLQNLFPDQRIEVMDWGCQGWTMAESVLNYLLRVHPFSPDIVIVHHGINDLVPRVRKDFRADYSHFRKPFSYRASPWLNRIASNSTALSWLQLLTGTRPGDLNTWTIHPNPGPSQQYPGEETTRVYRTGIETIARMSQAQGSRLIAAGMVYHPTGHLNARNQALVKEHNAILRDTADALEFEYIDLQSFYQHYPQWFLDQVHMRNQGNQSKAHWLANAAARLLNQTPNLTASILHTESNGIRIEWHIPSDPDDKRVLLAQNHDEKPEWIATLEGNATSFIWKEAASKGPKPGNRYRFILHRFRDEKNYLGPIVQASSLYYQK